MMFIKLSSYYVTLLYAAVSMNITDDETGKHIFSDYFFMMYTYIYSSREKCRKLKVENNSTYEVS